MQVQIVSIHAALTEGRPSILWVGEITEKDLSEVAGHPVDLDPASVNEALFRYFNRVDEADNDRLEDIGYTLPSLSVGDLVHWGGLTYRIAGVGFDQITNSSEYAMALTRYTLLTMDPDRKKVD